MNLLPNTTPQPLGRVVGRLSAAAARMWALRVAGWTVVLAALFAAAGAMLPLSPVSIREGFYATLHFGVATGKSFGTELISTFGPLGFLFYPVYFPATFAWLFALRAVLAGATCWALVWIGYAAWDGPWGAALAVGGCAPFLAVDDVWFNVLPLLAVLIELPGRRAPALLRVALGAAIGIASLIKFTFFISAFAVLVPLTAAAILTRRRIPLLTSAAVGAAAVAWMATGQRWPDLFAYLDWSAREISAGYSSAMQLPVDSHLIEHTVAVSAAVLMGGTLLAWRRLRWAGWPVVLALAAVLFLLFKAGFVRADVHVFITCFGLLVIAGLLAVLCGRRPWQVIVAALLLVLLPGRLWMHTVAVAGPPTLYFPPIFPPQALRRLIDGVAALRSGAFAAAHAQVVQAIRNGSPLPPLHGTIDAYPGDQALLLAYQADFRPRPIFQSYMAYTPRLAHANADALLGDRAPEWILFRVGPIDGGLPALDDAPSWPILLTHYRLAQTLGAFALLERRAVSGGWRLEPIENVKTQTDAVITVPSAASGPVWVRIDIRDTQHDVVMRTLLAAPQVRLAVSSRDGQWRNYRVVPALARDGFLLSPLVETTADFIQLEGLQDQALPAHDVTALRVLGFAREPRLVDVQFSRLVLDSTGAAEARGPDAPPPP